MTSTMIHCWVRTFCASVCKKCAKYQHNFAHLSAYPRNFMCVCNKGIIVDVTIASQRRSNVSHFTQHIPSLRVFWTAKTRNFRYDLRTWEDQFLQIMYKQIGTILGNSFVIDDNVELFWVTFDQSVATLSINTLWSGCGMALAQGCLYYCLSSWTWTNVYLRLSHAHRVVPKSTPSLLAEAHVTQEKTSGSGSLLLNTCTSLH